MERRGDAWSMDPTGMDATLALLAPIHFILFTSDPIGFVCEMNRQRPSASAESFDVTDQTDSGGFSGMLKFRLPRAEWG